MSFQAISRLCVPINSPFSVPSKRGKVVAPDRVGINKAKVLTQSLDLLAPSSTFPLLDILTTTLLSPFFLFLYLHYTSHIPFTHSSLLSVSLLCFWQCGSIYCSDPSSFQRATLVLQLRIPHTGTGNRNLQFSRSLFFETFSFGSCRDGLQDGRYPELSA